MKKLLSVIVCAVLAFGVAISAQAKTIQVSALEDFNTGNPPAELHVQMNANTRLDYDLMLFQGYQVTGKVVPQQGGFEFTPTSYVNFQEEQVPIAKAYPAFFKGPSVLIRQDQPFLLIFPENGPDTFQYYVPSSDDINK
ncbi:MAG TPA: hypothetical protein DEO94_04565 [Cyanobacteria bacterium UBA11991]|nr:hypothetical protein [Cyanobacteriota bacterium]MDY6358306.1 hypothetical protein [Cyanobacteriota bacterium]MDY6364387.1 hypothetical protein [Cyanobacteriota bacterium]MDY6383195.1 hypothetical protein [Cyanobacteriota bacterium]HCB11403.1 hypothetical protein [Cyanobacteria bacterium UBA11991]